LSLRVLGKVTVDDAGKFWVIPLVLPEGPIGSPSPLSVIDEVEKVLCHTYFRSHVDGLFGV